MKTLVIHPKDESTDFLKAIYADKNWTIINDNPSHSKLKTLIKEHDRIIMLGHGSQDGLYGFDRFVIDSTLVYLLREKECVCIWCYAHQFVEKYGLKGFHTDMFISELDEAFLMGVDCFSPSEINESNIKFAEIVNQYIDEANCLELIKNDYEPINEVVKYNRDRLYYSKSDIDNVELLDDNKEAIINDIKLRNESEYNKYRNNETINWADMAAHKIYISHFKK